MNNKELHPLIKIILSLLLALAFFTPYASLIIGENTPHRVILEIFIFGILAIIFLYIAHHSKLNYIITTFAKVLGYALSAYFILFYLGFLLYPLIEKGTFSFIKELLSSTFFLLSSIIILIVGIITSVILIIKFTS